MTLDPRDRQLKSGIQAGRQLLPAIVVLLFHQLVPEWKGEALNATLLQNLHLAFCEVFPLFTGHYCLTFLNATDYILYFSCWFTDRRIYIE